MTELSRDARALVSRVRRRDGPTVADRERVRKRLEEVWGEVDVAAPAAEVVTSSFRVLRIQPQLMAALILSIVFVAPEAPRPQTPLERTVPVTRAVHRPATAAPSAPAPTAAPVPPPMAAPTPAPQKAVRAPRTPAARARVRPARRDPTAPEPSETAPRSHEPAELSPPPLAARETAPPPPQAAEHPDHGRARITVVEQTPSEPRTHMSPGGSGDAAPVLRRDGFTPQPIAEELSWVVAAQNALRDRQPSRALRLVQEHAFRFPRGALAPERLAVQALSLCALQRKAAARQVLASLAARAPRSPLLDRVRRECGLP